MKVSIILGHPTPGSFNHAIVATAEAALRAHGHEVRTHDLYREGFDPVMPSEEIPKDALAAAGDRGALPGDRRGRRHHHRPPELLERAAGHPARVGRSRAAARPRLQLRARRPGRREAGGLLKASVGLVFTTANTPHEKELALFGDPLETHWLKVVFGLCGVATTKRWDFSPMIVSTPEQREAWLKQVCAAMAEYFPEGLEPARP